MSEKKTAEIKFRVAPSAKARWQEAAAAEGVSLSQLIDNAVNEYVWARQNARLDGTKLIDNAIGALDEKREPATFSDVQRSPWKYPDKIVDLGEDDPSILRPGLREFIRPNVSEVTHLTPELLDKAIDLVLESETPDIPVRDDEDPGADEIPAATREGLEKLFAPAAEACDCRPWEFCTHKARA